MIIAEIGNSRKLAGSLDARTEIIGAIQALCKNSEVSCGQLRGVGYIKDPVLRRYSRTQNCYLAPEANDGLYLVASCEGFVSLGENEAVDVLLHMVGTASEVGRNKTIVGQLMEAEVLQFEFILETFDNVNLKRLPDPSTGMNIWLQAVPTGEPMESENLLQLQPGDRSQETSAGTQLHTEMVEIELDEIELERGDWLDHPRLGQCLVLAPDNDERVPVKLPSGRVAELHLGLFKLFRIGKKQGGAVYKVEVRRKKG